MLTCADCPNARTLHPKANTSLREPLNVLCVKHGTVEPAINFYKVGKVERFGPIEAKDCFPKKGGR